MTRTCSPNSVPRYMHSGPKVKAGPCVLRESPTGRVIIVIVAERKREKTREGRERRREDRRRERKKDRQEEEREIEHERQRRRKTPACVRSKRLRVCGQDVSVCIRKTPACSTHAGAFPEHTEAS